jgi:hypothetical protein
MPANRKPKNVPLTLHVHGVIMVEQTGHFRSGIFIIDVRVRNSLLPKGNGFGKFKAL